MESPATVSRYISQNSKKRVFPGGSSSTSAGCKDVEVLEIPPPSINRSSIPRSNKQKEVICHEIIDVDMDEDCADVMLIDGEVSKSAKGKEILSQTSQNGAGDDFNSNLLYGEDEWIDTYYDDIVYDDYSIMESHFDHMDIPPGVEAPFPWLPTSPRKTTSASVTKQTSNSSSYRNGINLSSGLGLSHSWPSKPVQIKDPSAPWSNSAIGMPDDLHHFNEKLPPKSMKPVPNQNKSTTSVSGSYDTSQSQKRRTTSSSSGYPQATRSLLGKGRKRYHSSNFSSILHSKFSSGATYPSSLNTGSVNSTLHMPKMSHTAGTGAYMPMWGDLPMNMLDPSMGLSGYMNGGAFGPWAPYPASNQNGASSVDTPAPARIEPRNVDEILQKFDGFKKFDTVEDYSDHHYASSGSSTKQPSKNWAKRIQEEWRILEKDLPDSIFVRVYESRMDLLRAVIVGAEGTPYHDGLFFFDVFFPSSYPNVPPHVHYHSGGLRINPNLYHCGKVCLSLLNTWGGSQKEKWIAGTSTMLQVLVSIQGLILNAKPYFNEPGYAKLSGSVSGEQSSLQYNERTFMLSLRTMVYNMRRPPKHFEDFAIGHFCRHARDILVSCKAYLEGAQVGCLVKGGVQDVDEGDKSCSQYFKGSLAGFITTLVNTFSEIGAKDCEEFLSLAQKATVPATAPHSVLPFYY